MALSASEELSEHLVEFYDRVAVEYDGWAGGLHMRVAAKLLEVARPRPGEACLDVGCGTGLVTGPLAKAVAPKGTAVGIDLSPRMLEQARKRKRANLTFMAMAAEGKVFKEHRLGLVPY